MSKNSRGKLGDKELLLFYVERINEMKKTKVITDRLLNTSHTFRVNNIDKHITQTSKEPKEELLLEFLLPLRKFILKSEVLNSEKVFNVCYDNLIDEKLKNYIMKSRGILLEGLTTDGPIILFKERVYNSNDILDLWINGYYFHDDIKKREILKILQGVAATFSRSMFFASIISYWKHLTYLQRVIQNAFENNLFKFSSKQ